MHALPLQIKTGKIKRHFLTKDAFKMERFVSGAYLSVIDKTDTCGNNVINIVINTYYLNI